jgi:hypothetical protein
MREGGGRTQVRACPIACLPYVCVRLCVCVCVCMCVCVLASASRPRVIQPIPRTHQHCVSTRDKSEHNILSVLLLWDCVNVVLRRRGHGGWWERGERGGRLKGRTLKETSELPPHSHMGLLPLLFWPACLASHPAISEEDGSWRLDFPEAMCDLPVDAQIDHGIDHLLVLVRGKLLPQLEGMFMPV